MNRIAVIFVLIAGALNASSSQASYCLIPDLDSSFDRAELVFIAVLTSASTEDLYTALGHFRVEDSLKGEPPPEISLDAHIGPTLSCGLELIIGKPYLVFLNKGQASISPGTGSRIVDGKNNIIDWIVYRQQKKSTAK